MKPLAKLLIHIFVINFCAVLSTAVILTSSDCTITDPNLDHTFNFSALHSELGHVFKHGNTTYKMNVCQPDLKCSSYATPVSACEVVNGTERVLGYNSSLTWEDGRMSFDFVGEQCSETEKYNLKVILMCTYNLQKVQEPIRVMPKSDPNKCNSIAYWETDLACLPKYQFRYGCILRSKNIDMNQLYEMNHKVMAQDGKSHFLINVCEPVLYGINTTCPKDASICYVDGDESDSKKKFKNYGKLDRIEQQHGEYVLIYKSPEKCKRVPECDPLEEMEEPVFVRETNDCELIFTMKTSLVCGIEPSCFVYNPLTDAKYDLSSLSHRSFPITYNGRSFTYGVCTSPWSPCSQTDGACEYDYNVAGYRKIGYGQISPELKLNSTNDHVTYVEYRDGDICNKTDGTRWRTQIIFHCDETGKEKYKVIEDGNCTLVISHPTRIMCHSSIACSVTSNSGLTIDLSPLKQHQGNFLAKIDPNLKEYTNYKFYLHVCRPLYLESGLNCPGSSSCRTITVNGKEEHETNLGYADVSLTLIDSIPVLKYLHGDVCDKDNSTNYLTEIHFMCDPSEENSVPVLKEVQEGCHYIFNWKTNKICEPEKCTYISETCSLTNPDLDANVKLKDIFNGSNIQVNDNQEKLNIDVCNKENDVSYVLTQYRDDAVIFKFTSKEHKCVNKTDEYLSVILELRCGKEVNQSSNYDNDINESRVQKAI
uniref:CSON004175 protein n=1 Tax=Culicoides sonorensis TaxID=179676 RepID=A0A336L4R6_CULSO